MKKIFLLLLVSIVLLTACSPAGEQGESIDVLTITTNDEQMTFSANDLASLPNSEVVFREVNYRGVQMSALLKEAGVNIDAVKAVKGVATDGYSVNYDKDQVLKDNVLIAYILADGSSLNEEDGLFRMVLPDEEGKLNLRMLAELVVVQ